MKQKYFNFGDEQAAADGIVLPPQAEVKLEKGYKSCPKCHKPKNLRGRSSRHCETLNCDYIFPVEEKKKKKKKHKKGNQQPLVFRPVKMSETKATKVADAVLCDGGKWKWVYVNNFDFKDNSRAYFFSVNDYCKRIGGSEAEGGIKNGTLSFYENIGGNPGKSRFTVNRLIKNCLLQGSKVEAHVIWADDVRTIVRGFYSETRRTIHSSYKAMEKQCIADFKDREGTLPEWNLQESGGKYPQDIMDEYFEIYAKKNKNKGQV